MRTWMLSSKGPWHPISLAFIAFLIVPPGQAEGKDWKEYRSQAGFPAYVRAITGFPGTLDRRNCLTIKRWKVCFGAQRPVARLSCEEKWCPILSVKNLLCKNEVVGNVDCILGLTHEVGNGDSCNISLGDFRNRKFLKVNCPKEMFLE